MPRRLFTLAALLSLLLSAATTVLWVRSYWGATQFYVPNTAAWHWDAGSTRGVVCVPSSPLPHILTV